MTENSEIDADIPVLDVKQMSADADDLKRMAQEVYDAFTTIGFLAVVNHGIPEDLVRSHELDWSWNNLQEIMKIIAWNVIWYNF